MRPGPPHGQEPEGAGGAHGGMWSTVIRRRALALCAGAVMALGAAPAAAAGTPQPFCGQVWGSLPEAVPMRVADAVVTDVRAGRHECFDRLVVDLHGEADRPLTYTVRYAPQVREPGSGHTVPLRGGAALQVVVGAPAHGEQRQPTYVPADRAELVDVDGYGTFRHVALAGSFEGQTSVGLGTRARLPFRTFTLAGPDSGQVRLVVDVAHRW